jgi:hypothetical protein
VQAQIARAADGSPILDGDTGEPLPMVDERGAPVAVEGDVQAGGYVEVHRTFQDYKRRGAYPRRRSMKDFMMLPNHAEDDREVWGRALRFWLTMDECEHRAKIGEFDREAVEQLGGDTQERQQASEQDRIATTVEYTPGYGQAEKELFRLQFWANLDGKGLCLYLAVVSEVHDVILSLQHDWLPYWRTIYVNPYPCPYSVYGYSLILKKLLTTIEEHTAWRNMNADRGTLKSNAPMKRLTGAQWDPTIQPFGAGEVIDVGDMNEIQPFAFEDVSPQAMTKEQQCVTDAQRIVGMNDIGIGQISSERRTLGENELATQQSFVRTDDPIGNVQEAMEELGTVIHAIEVQTLQDMDEGRDAPASVVARVEQLQQGAMSTPGTNFEGTFTVEMISGQFRFKPRGSTEAADPNRRRATMAAGLGMLANWSKLIPGVAERLQAPGMAEALMQWWADEFKPRDRKPFITAPAPPPMPGGPGMPPGVPGMPPGLPGAPGMRPPMPGAPGAAGGPGGAPGAPAAPNFGAEQLLAQLRSALPGAGTVQ